MLGHSNKPQSTPRDLENQNPKPFEELGSHERDKPSDKPSAFMSVSTGFFYAVSSIVIILVNKHLLTVLGFPSVVFLMLFQSLATVVCLQVGSWFGWMHLPPFQLANIWTLQPLPLLFIVNVFFGLAGSKGLSIPMFTVLRRFTLLITLVGEALILNDKKECAIIMCVFLMIGGALLAAVNDLAFDIRSYGFVLGNNLCTSLYGVVMKQKLNAKSLGSNGLVFVNSLCSIPFLVMTLFAFPEWTKFDQLQDWDWTDPVFQFSFLCSSLLGFILNMAIMLGTKYNSALTVSVIGSLKNIITTFWGMVFGGDYIFSINNFSGILISLMGSLIYAYLTILKSAQGASRRKIQAFFLLIFFSAGMSALYMLTVINSSGHASNVPIQSNFSVNTPILLSTTVVPETTPLKVGMDENRRSLQQIV
eukprot:gb/GEZN01008473.1/.p1 GENE.gb/GEZN01008473.1/~~gb/GEZN01008473.1/.p1  ORF type:complete len:419 (-),score=48.68 gb/GEZN01008473.1/:27-1283(-)